VWLGWFSKKEVHLPFDTAESVGNFCRHRWGEANSGGRTFLRKLFNDVPTVAVEWLPLLFRILEVPDSNTAPKTGCAVVFLGFFSRSMKMLGYLERACDHFNFLSKLLIVNSRIIRSCVIGVFINVVK
jgi:hypothetical protein